MTVQEIGIPTGFEAKTDEIALMREVKKIEEENKKVVLYFDEVKTLNSKIKRFLNYEYHKKSHNKFGAVFCSDMQLRL